MPLLLLTVVITNAFFLTIYLSLTVKEKSAKLEAERFWQQTHYLVINLPVKENPRIEKLNNLLRRICQIGQSLIVRCQYCETKNPGNCPYPTEEFCQSAEGVNYNNPRLVWGFLPNEVGTVDDLLNTPACAPDGTCFYGPEDLGKLKDIRELPAYLLSLAQRLVSPSDGKLIYHRPEGKASDICAVEGVITGELQ